jgi:hypothetical protein
MRALWPIRSDFGPYLLRGSTRHERDGLCPQADANPIEKLWQFLRQRHLSHRLFRKAVTMVGACLQSPARRAKLDPLANHLPLVAFVRQFFMSPI